MFVIKRLVTKRSCTGCGACEVLCPAKAIKMRENSLGELVSEIDVSLCIGCDLCTQNCPQNTIQEFVYPSKCFVAWSKNERDWIYSASGGVGISFFRCVVQEGGIAFGCDYNENIELTHFKIKNENDLFRSQSSKYSQSKAYLVYNEIRDFLFENKQVIFIGTPCQIAGLKGFLKRDYEQLITVDLICHGTPPNRYLREHVLKISKSENVSKVRFRGEFDQNFSVWSGEEIIYQKVWCDDIYFNLFYQNVISRDSCYLCQYAQPKRVSDLTIGDFWGLNKLLNIQRKSNRPSVVLINTEKGRKFFDTAKEYLFYEERSVEEGIRGNGRLNSPPGKNYYTYIFRTLYVVFGFEKTAKITLFVKRWLSKFLR